MTTRSHTAVVAPSGRGNVERLSVFHHGVAAGLVSAATIAVWLLVLDSFSGRPFHTPTVLGTALFRHGKGLAALEGPPVSLEIVLMFTWAYTLVCAAVGGAASWLLSLAARSPHLGFGVLLLFVVCEFVFVAVAMIFAQPLLHALAWPAVLVTNLLAAAAMAGYFRPQHPDLQIRP